MGSEEAPTNRVTVNLTHELGEIDRHLFGGFAEHLGRCIYGGIYEPESPHADAHGFRTDVLEALVGLRLSVIRYPGGNFASGYRWRDGVGPQTERPAREELAWHTVESNAFGTNECIQLCRALGAEPYLVVNCGDGDSREARDWVEYCNGTHDTALAQLRRAHGFAEPHRVRYWGIGNEVDGPWQIGAKTAEEYARACTEYAKVMKWVDPQIRLIASGTSTWHADWVERGQLLLEQAGDHIDYLALHWYVGNPEHDFARYMALSELFEARLSAYEGLIRAVTLARSLAHPPAIAVDEWNVWYRTGADEGLEEHYSLEDALVVALHLNAFIRHAQFVRMANLAQIVNVIAPILTTPERCLLQTIYHPFALYSTQCGEHAVQTDWTGDTFSAGAATGAPLLDVAASLRTTPRQLVLFVVNRAETQPTEAEVALSVGRFAGPVRMSVINGPEITAQNTFERPDEVGVHEVAGAVDGPSGTFVFEPHSVTALVCTLA